MYTFTSMISYVSGSMSYILKAGYPPEFSRSISEDCTDESTNNRLVGVRAGEIDANATAVVAL
jgi:hypothetical protein